MAKKNNRTLTFSHSKLEITNRRLQIAVSCFQITDYSLHSYILHITGCILQIAPASWFRFECETQSGIESETESGTQSEIVLTMQRRSYPILMTKKNDWTVTFSHSKLKITHHRLQIAVYCFQITDCSLHIADYRLYIAVCRLQFAPSSWFGFEY